MFKSAAKAAPAAQTPGPAPRATITVDSTMVGAVIDPSPGHLVGLSMTAAAPLMRRSGPGAQIVLADSAMAWPLIATSPDAFQGFAPWNAIANPIGYTSLVVRDCPPGYAFSITTSA
jgi:hypothetical protein